MWILIDHFPNSNQCGLGIVTVLQLLQVLVLQLLQVFVLQLFVIQIPMCFPWMLSTYSAS